jgi:hypothetical protein
LPKLRSRRLIHLLNLRVSWALRLAHPQSSEFAAKREAAEAAAAALSQNLKRPELPGHLQAF